MIGVGIIGVNSERGWALEAHIPALAASSAFALRAVATSRQETAIAAAKAWGVNGYCDAAALAADPNVDLVVIAVKVPHHAQLIRSVLPAGKAVFCEWPLGNGLAETEELARLAKEGGVRNFVGLQGRASPGYRHVRQLVDDHYVGDILSTSIIASSPLPGPVVDIANAYALDACNGATMSMIPFGHTIDAVCWCLGELDDLVATTASRRRSAVVIGREESVPITIADQIAVAGRLPGGAFLSAHYRGGLSAATGFLWEIIGTEGVITVTASHGVTEMIDLTVSGTRGPGPLAILDTPQSCRWAPPGTPEGMPYNIGQLYALIAEDLRTGSHQAPSFEDAALRHTMLAAIDPTLLS